MKKQILLTVLGFASAAAAYGQGQVFFANYNFGAGLDSPIRYNANPLLVPAGKAGLLVGSTFNVELQYSVAASVSGPTDASWVSVPSSITAIGFGPVADGAVGQNAGDFYFGAVTLPAVTAGNAGAVFFQILAWQTAGPTGGASYDLAQVHGRSGIFQSTAIKPVATGLSPAADFTGYGLQPWTVQFDVPEPGTLALAGLGAAGLLLFRRRK